MLDVARRNDVASLRIHVDSVAKEFVVAASALNADASESAKKAKATHALQAT
jgi:hypothetical protein